MAANTSSCALGEKFISAIYQGNQSRVGDAFLRAKNGLALGGLSGAAKAYQLLGDPALLIGISPAPR